MAEQSGTKPCTGTGVFLPRISQSKKGKTNALSRKVRSSGRGNQDTTKAQQYIEHTCHGQQVQAMQQRQLGQQQLGSAGLRTNSFSPIYDCADLQQLQMPHPICSGTGTLSANSSFTSGASSPFAQFSAADSFVLSPCVSRDNSFTACGLTSQGPFVSSPGLTCAGTATVTAPQQLTTGCVGTNSTIDQELLLLQQQEAEVDAAITDLLNLRQQLTAMRQPAQLPAAPAHAPALAASMAPALPVSLATAALGQQQLLLPAPQQQVCTGAYAGTAQYQLASLQAQQQQLCTAEQQLQAELAAEMVRFLGLA